MSRIINPPVLIVTALSVAAIYSDAVPPILRVLSGLAWAAVAADAGRRGR